MYNWSDFNIALPQDFEGSVLVDCPSCKPTRKKEEPTLEVFEEHKCWFCKHCGFSGDLFRGEKHLPKHGDVPWGYNPALRSYSVEEGLSAGVLTRFKKRGISQETLNHFKVGMKQVYSPALEEVQNCITIPYYRDSELVNIIYFQGKNRFHEIGGVETCFNQDAIDTENTYFTCDEIEVFSFHEAGVPNVISMFGGKKIDLSHYGKNFSSSFDFLLSVEKKLSAIKRITLALPNTDIGDRIQDEMLRRLGKERCWVVRPPQRGYSWNQVLSEYGKEKMLSLLEEAAPVPVRGVFELGEVEDKLDDLYENGFRRGASTGWASLDECYTVVPGQWTVVTGIPNHGKSNWLDALIVNLAEKQGWNFAMFSPENQPIERHYANLMEKYLKKPFDVNRHNRITREEKDEAKKWLKKHFSVILPHEDDSASVDGVLSLAKVLVYRKGIRGLVLDPWNEFDHSRPANKNETEYVSEMLTKIRQFARNHSVHVWLVAHPAKLYKDKDGKYPVPTPYDISGSAHYRNKADNAITVWRNVGGPDQTCTDIHVQKIRFKEVGKVGLVSLRYDPVAGAFIDDIDQQKRVKMLESGECVETERLRKRYA